MTDPIPEFVHAMKSSGFYPHAVDSIELRETHISWVFLTGEIVYKIKKPVKLGFLDFSTPDKRAHFCGQEVELNRRLSTDVYLGVASITRTDEGFCLDGGGDVVETAVKMRQLDPADSLDQRLREEGLDAVDIDRLALTLVGFYERAATGPGIDRFGSREMIRKNCLDNFSRIRGIDCHAVRPDDLEMIASATRAFLEEHPGRFETRLRNRRIRDCHGDLRSEHVYLTHGAIQIIDCIEFNPRFRYGDVAGDLAFLAMTLDAQGYCSAAAELISSFAAHATDYHLFSVLDFYKCYRAMVRVKVGCLRLGQTGTDRRAKADIRSAVERHMRLARGYAMRFSRPTLWVVCGQMATGKSTLAHALGDALDIPILRSDEIRKRMFGVSREESRVSGYAEGMYSPAATSRTYDRLFRQAQSEMDNNRSVILDATFSRRWQRREAARIGEAATGGLVWVHCHCSDETIRRRLRARQDRDGVSDARIEHLAPSKAEVEPWDGNSPGVYIRADTERPPEANLRKVLSVILNHTLSKEAA